MNTLFKKTIQLTFSLALPLVLGGLLHLIVFFGLPFYTPPPAYAAGEICFAAITTTTAYSSTDAQAVRDAVGAASDGNTIKLAGYCAGVDGTLTVGEFKVVNVNKNLTIRGGYTTINWDTPYPITQPTTLDAQRAGRVIYINGKTVTLENLHIISGATTASYDGGGLYITGGGADVVISNSTIYSNTSADWGGGMYNKGLVNVTVLNSMVVSNTSVNHGGGIGHDGSGTTTLNGSQVNYNRSSLGGGLSGNSGVHYVLTNSLVSHNWATNFGGGLTLLNYSQADVVNSTVFSNTALNYGGGLNNDLHSTMALTETVVSHNRATNFGGGIRTDGPLTIHGGQVISNVVTDTNGDGGGLYTGNSNAIITQTGVMTLAYNQTGDDGGGLYASQGQVNLTNARILYNSAGGIGGALYQNSNGTITVTNSCLVYNSDTAVYYSGGGPTLTATANWWGAADGPGGVGPGSGDSINNLANIDYSGFLTSAPAGCPIRPSDLTLTKSVNIADTEPGQIITYTLSFTNNGDAAAENVVITDFVPVSITVQSVISSGDVVITRTTPGQTAEVFETSKVFPAQSGLITLTVQVSSSLSSGDRFTNTATITTTTIESNTTNNTSQAGAVAYATCFVESNGDNTTDYASVDAGAIQSAVNAAPDGDTLKIAGTCAGVQQSAGLTQTVYLSQNLTLRGGYTTTWTTSDPTANPTVLDAQSLGRVIYIPSGYTVTLDSLTVQHGTNSSSGGGGIYMNNGQTVLTAVQVISNTANYGGGIENDGGVLMATNSIISDNVASISGGGIMNYDGTLKLNSATLQGNTASNSGGGLYGTGNSSTTVLDSLLRHNRANSYGGGLYAASGSGSTVISNTQIISNTSDSQGGGGFYAAQPITISHSLINQNATTTAGAGGWLNNNPHFLIENSDIISNASGIDGGGLYIYPTSQGEIRGTRLLSNTAADYGGGIYLEEIITLSVTDSELAYNISGSDGGGGIYAYTDSNLTLQDSRVHHNTTDGYGGGIYAEYNVTLAVVNSELSYNTSTTSDGGGLYLQQSHAQVQNSTLSHNQAQTGGGIYAIVGTNSSLITLTHTTLVSNTGVITGGGIYLSDSNKADAYIAQATMQNSIIAGNGSADCVTRKGWEVLDASPGYNLDSDGTCVTDGVDNNLTSADPGLGPLQDNGGDTETHALLDGSPALDVIPVVSSSCNNSGVVTDQRGISRPQGNNCDIGAVERTTTSISIYLPIVLKNN